MPIQGTGKQCISRFLEAIAQKESSAWFLSCFQDDGLSFAHMCSRQVQSKKKKVRGKKTHLQKLIKWKLETGKLSSLAVYNNMQ